MHDDDMLPRTNDRPELIRARARVNVVEALWRWFWVAMLAVVIGLLLFDAFQGRAVRNEILSCTTPEGECYQQSLDRQTRLVEALYNQGIDREQITRQIIVLAASCAGDTKTRTAEEIEQCVNDRLAKENRVDVP